MLSDFSLISLPTKSAYASSKHAARAFTESLSAELAGTGIIVTAAYPGATATQLVARGYASDETKREREARMLARGMTAAAVGERIVHAVERKRSRVLIGTDAHLIDLATRLAPNIVQRVIRRYWRRFPFL